MISFKPFSGQLILLLLLCFPLHAQNQVDNENERSAMVRQYYVQTLVKIADPVLQSLSKNQLKASMPVEKSPYAWDERTNVTYLEAIGRLLSGMAPWLELGPDDTQEGRLREKYAALARQGIKNATDPESADFMNFTRDVQPLVDAAFLAQALLRAPTQLWAPLDPNTKENVLLAFKSTRQIEPYYNNWLLFSAMIEAALLKFSDGEEDRVRINYALNKHSEWYAGDGTYGDGPEFHWDYYNSFVIQPMMLDILKTMQEAGLNKEKQLADVLRKARRYAEIQERLISPEGTYPPIGRSLAYRFGAFQLLSQVALWQELPESVSPAQVRSALYEVIKKQVEAPGTFDEQGWLQIGLYGHQPNIGEGYISTGSLYLCSEAFMVLGLPENTSFWSDPAEPWTQKKIWSGMAIPIDHALRAEQD